MAFLGPFNSGVANPSLVLLGETFHQTTTQISYTTTIAIIMGGVAVCFGAHIPVRETQLISPS